MMVEEVEAFQAENHTADLFEYSVHLSRSESR